MTQTVTEGGPATVSTPGLPNFTTNSVKGFPTISEGTLGNTAESLGLQEECARLLGKTEAHWLVPDRIWA